MKIFYTNVNELNEYSQNVLKDYNDEKIPNYRFDIDRYRTLLGNFIIRNTIINKYHIHNYEIEKVKNDFGKPYIKGLDDFHFNVSHAGDYVLCGIDDTSIGVDIEKYKSIECLSLAKRFFTFNEHDYIKIGFEYDALQKLDLSLDTNLEKSKGVYKFFTIWTLKEAYVKCIGKGLSIPLKSFDISIDTNENVTVVDECEENNLYMKIIHIDDLYASSLCSTKKDFSYELIKVNANDVVNQFLTLSNI